MQSAYHEWNLLTIKLMCDGDDVDKYNPLRACRNRIEVYQ